MKMRWDLHRARLTLQLVQAREELKKSHIENWLKVSAFYFQFPSLNPSDLNYYVKHLQGSWLLSRILILSSRVQEVRVKRVLRGKIYLMLEWMLPSLLNSHQ